MCASNRKKISSVQYHLLIINLLFIIFSLPDHCFSLDPPPLTPVEEFFIQNNFSIPPVPADWHLTVEGAVHNVLSLTLEDLMNYPATTLMATLECPMPTEMLIGNANWTGVPLHTIIEATSPLNEAQSISFYALDGYSIRFSLNDMLQREDIILAYGMNGETLPLEQGYPLRLVVPGVFGYQWMQWVERIEITTDPSANTLRSFPAHYKIVEPKDEETITLCDHTISGLAFVGEGREITNVGVSTDGGVTWEPAELLTYFIPNVWKFWEFNWDVPQEGEYQICARAEDNLGNVQGELGPFGWRTPGITAQVVDNLCRGDFESDGDVDGTDAIKFKTDFGRKSPTNPCTATNPCNGDFDCDGNVDGSDAILLKKDFGRRDCPSCSFACYY